MGYNYVHNFRGVTTEDVESEVYEINQTINNAGAGSIIALLESTGTTDGILEFWGGNSDDNLIKIEEYAIDAATMNIPINMQFIVKFLQIKIIMNNLTEVNYKIDCFL
jgi:hypothetical protein